MQKIGGGIKACMEKAGCRWRYMAVFGDGKSGIFCEDSLDIMQNWRHKTETGSFGIEMSRFLYAKKKYFSCNHFCNRVI